MYLSAAEQGGHEVQERDGAHVIERQPIERCIAVVEAVLLGGAGGHAEQVAVA